MGWVILPSACVRCLVGRRSGEGSSSDARPASRTLGSCSGRLALTKPSTGHLVGLCSSNVYVLFPTQCAGIGAEEDLEGRAGHTRPCRRLPVRGRPYLARGLKKLGEVTSS